jgi:hypothetical protein
LVCFFLYSCCKRSHHILLLYLYFYFSQSFCFSSYFIILLFYFSLISVLSEFHFPVFLLSPVFHHLSFLFLNLRLIFFLYQMLQFISSNFILFSSPSSWTICKRAITVLSLFLFICSLSSSLSKSCYLLRFLSPLFSSLPLSGFKILFTGEESRKYVICIFCQACMVMEHFTVRRGNCLTLQHRGSGVAIDCTREGERSCLILHQRGGAAAGRCTRKG